MLGCIQPISSPMMKRMLGFCCCCADGCELTNATAATPAVKPRANFRDAFIGQFLLSLSGLRFEAHPSNDASEPQMACGRVHVFGMARRRPIAAAVIRRAQM